MGIILLIFVPFPVMLFVRAKLKKSQTKTKKPIWIAFKVSKYIVRSFNKFTMVYATYLQLAVIQR